MVGFPMPDDAGGGEAGGGARGKGTPSRLQDALADWLVSDAGVEGLVAAGEAVGLFAAPRDGSSADAGGAAGGAAASEPSGAPPPPPLSRAAAALRDGSALLAAAEAVGVLPAHGPAALLDADSAALETAAEVYARVALAAAAAAPAVVPAALCGRLRCSPRCGCLLQYAREEPRALLRDATSMHDIAAAYRERIDVGVEAVGARAVAAADSQRRSHQRALGRKGACSPRATLSHALTLRCADASEPLPSRCVHMRRRC
jgi:hypothetical protein